MANPSPTSTAHRIAAAIRPLPCSDGEIQAVLNALPEPVFVLRAILGPGGELHDLQYRLINDAAVQLYGRPREHVIGHTIAELFPSVRASSRWATYQRVVATGGPAALDSLAFDENDLKGDFSLLVAPFGDGIVVTVRDISDRLRIQRDLLEERDLSRAMLDVAAALIVVLDPTGHIVRFNRQCELVSGYEAAEVRGQHLRFLVPAEERIALTGRLASDGSEVGFVNHWVTKSGERRVVRWSVTGARDSDGRLTYLIVGGADITEERRRQDELEHRAAELQRSNADLEVFAHVASHDLREPLRSISLPIQLVADKYKGKLDAKADEFLGYALDGCARMEERIEGLLAYSRVGRGPLVKRPVSSAAVVAQAIAALRSSLDASHATVVSDNDLPVVLADADQLSEVFENLISNAVKFVAPAVEPAVRISCERDDRMWRFSVTDNGIGVTPNDRERVFGMFTRAVRNGDFPGSGIGLALVQRIVEHHGGEVGTEDAPGGTGSRFWFTLPVADEAPDDDCAPGQSG